MAHSIPWLAGLSECTITPPVGAPLLGSIQRSTGTHDNLFARVLVLSDGIRGVAIAGLDLIGMDFSMGDEIRQGIQEKSGIDTHFLNCSHTHSAPFTIPWSVLGWNWLMKVGRPWRDQVVQKVIDAVADAAAHLSPVRLRCGRADVQIGINRRLPTEAGIVMKPNPNGIVIPWVDVLCVDDQRGRPLSVLFSHAAHPLIVHGASKMISADYVAAAVQEIKNQLGDHVVPVFAQGCAANINGEPLRGGFDKAAQAGQKLGAAVVSARARAVAIPNIAFETAHRSFGLPLQSLPSLAECDRALREVERRLSSVGERKESSEEELWDMQDVVDINRMRSQVEDDVQPMENQPWWLRDTALCLQDLRSRIKTATNKPLRFEIQSIRIKDVWSLTAMTHELFAELQIWYDKTAPCQHNMIVSYTNACESYVPPDAALSEGGYEAASFPSLDGASLRYRHRLSIKEGAEAQIKGALSSLWSRV